MCIREGKFLSSLLYYTFAILFNFIHMYIYKDVLSFAYNHYVY